MPLPSNEALTRLIERSKITLESMSPAQQQEMFDAQRKSWVRGEMGMGSDRDEAEYAKAMNDPRPWAKLSELKPGDVTKMDPVLPAQHEEPKMSDFQEYRRKQIAELRPYVPGEDLSARVSISAADQEAGSPKEGDMIARNPKNHDDMWLVAQAYFRDNFEPVQ
jgi:hypothetical protein